MYYPRFIEELFKPQDFACPAGCALSGDLFPAIHAADL